MPLSAADAAHLIRRTGFGVTPALFDEARALGSRRAAVERLTDPHLAEDDALTAPSVVPFVTRGADVELMQAWWLSRMVYSAAPLVEKLTLFWHSHFASSADKVSNVNLLMAQNQLFRELALGSFAELAQRASVDPAMLVYLDNHANVASAPQENFGRELLEVFTLGPAERTEADVVAMTRAWTGHGLDRLPEEAGDGKYQFHPAEHDDGDKVLFGLPPRNWDGPAALQELLFGSRAEPMSRFITAKLFSFLAHPVTTDDPVVHRLASGFRASKLDLHALVRSILLSEEFWSPAARGALVRSPVEWVVAALQATNQAPLVIRPYAELAQMGQLLFHPPTVAGWGLNDHWLGTARSWGKAAFARRLAASVTDVFGDLSTMPPEVVATRAFQHFGIITPSPVTRRAVEEWVRRTRSEGGAKHLSRNLVVLILLTPDFQLA